MGRGQSIALTQASLVFSPLLVATHKKMLPAKTDVPFDLPQLRRVDKVEPTPGWGWGH